MKSKSLIIPVAAFALLAAGTASAFSTETLRSAGFTDDQIAAFAAAKELREEGNREEARDILVEAGVTEEAMNGLRELMHEKRSEAKEAMRAALEAEDYDAFLEAIADTPLAEYIESEADFEKFKEAHELRTRAQELMTELGIERPEKPERGFGRHHGGVRGVFGEE